jgi:hypothetical protein
MARVRFSELQLSTYVYLFLQISIVVQRILTTYLQKKRKVVHSSGIASVFLVERLGVHIESYQFGKIVVDGWRFFLPT